MSTLWKENACIRQREVCSHDSALFAVEISNKEENHAPTTVPCLWNKTCKRPDAEELEVLTDVEKTSCARKLSIRKTATNSTL
ncbi:hypothetical protein NPIL_365511 [Nephila pilipes]|uniref:Uncharacterized protein n=1 Tax=Nephila pilipes TaxID=299642 RepID=A0A8X6PZ58_NEPPI|nr:hypothetical protein NPIL_365511 [Nephila pilipes]